MLKKFVIPVLILIFAAACAPITSTLYPPFDEKELSTASAGKLVGNWYFFVDDDDKEESRDKQARIALKDTDSGVLTINLIMIGEDGKSKPIPPLTGAVHRIGDREYLSVTTDMEAFCEKTGFTSLVLAMPVYFTFQIEPQQDGFVLKYISFAKLETVDGKEQAVTTAPEVKMDQETLLVLNDRESLRKLIGAGQWVSPSTLTLRRQP